VRQVKIEGTLASFGAALWFVARSYVPPGYCCTPEDLKPMPIEIVSLLHAGVRVGHSEDDQAKAKAKAF
jgi:hypothetical protein